MSYTLNSRIVSKLEQTSLSYKVKMQSVSELSDDDVGKRLSEKPLFELAAKGVFRLHGKILHLLACRAFQIFLPATGKARLPTVDRLTDGTRRQWVPVEQSDRLPWRLLAGHHDSWPHTVSISLVCELILLSATCIIVLTYFCRIFRNCTRHSWQQWRWFPASWCHV